MAVNEVFWSAERVSLLVDKLDAAPVVKAGDPVRVGGINAVAITDAAGPLNTGANVGYVPKAFGSRNQVPTGNERGYASCKTTGAFRFDVAAGAVIAIGTPIYAIADADTAIKKVSLTTTASGNKLFGVALEAFPSGGTVKCAVKLAEITV